MRRDNSYLEDIRLACEDIALFIHLIGLREFRADEKTRAAVERKIMIIGEAASKISIEMKSRHPEVPWGRLVQLRNFYVHAYERVAPEEVWALRGAFCRA